MESEGGRNKEMEVVISKLRILGSEVGWEIRAISWHRRVIAGLSQSGEDIGAGNSSFSS
jgi:hypothetical protein